ncbi:peptidase associated/transthyretin-like domain-containing protein [Flavitalea flava]
MKQRFTLFLAFLLLSAIVRAEKEPKAALAQKMSRLGGVQFKFNNHVSNLAHKDSVLLIFDRCDHTGAGVIYQIFYMDQDGNITIPAIRAGKYFVTIQCLGLHRDRMEKVVTIKSNKGQKVKINLLDSEVFSKENVVIPVFRPDFSDLAVLKRK